MKTVVVLVFLLLQVSSVSKKHSLESYLEKISFKQAFNSKYILILPLNYDYYVDSHWVFQFLNFNYEYKDLSTVIVEEDVDIINTLITNKSLQVKFDTKAIFFNSSLFQGSPILCTKLKSGFDCVGLKSDNTYQLKVNLFRKIHKKPI